MLSFTMKALSMLGCLAFANGQLSAQVSADKYKAFLQLTEQVIILDNCGICVSWDKVPEDIANALTEAFNEEFSDDETFNRHFTASFFVGFDATEFCASCAGNRRLGAQRQLRDEQTGQGGTGGTCTNCPDDPPACDDTHNSSCDRRRRLTSARLARISAKQQQKLAGKPYTVGDLSFVPLPDTVKVLVDDTNAQVNVTYMEKTIAEKEQELQVAGPSGSLSSTSASFAAPEDSSTSTSLGSSSLQAELRHDEQELADAQFVASTLDQQVDSIMNDPTPEEAAANAVLASALLEAKSKIDAA